jgi:hypothetical protein
MDIIPRNSTPAGTSLSKLLGVDFISNLMKKCCPSTSYAHLKGFIRTTKIVKSKGRQNDQCLSVQQALFPLTNHPVSFSEQLLFSDGSSVN